MIFSGVEHMGETPFKTVYIHGLVRDAQGRKMSKSLGNGIDPLEVIDQYGADALRFTLATGNSPGNDMRFSDERVQASRNFCNKIWNASRFIQMNLTIDKDKAVELPSDLAIEDKWIISKFNTLVADVTRNIDQYELGLAAAKLNDFIWENFCDWYIEIAKTRLQTGDENVQKVLCYVLSGAMQLLHPFMPFITETIWQALPRMRSVRYGIRMAGIRTSCTLPRGGTDGEPDGRCPRHPQPPCRDECTALQEGQGAHPDREEGHLLRRRRLLPQAGLRFRD